MKLPLHYKIIAAVLLIVATWLTVWYRYTAWHTAKANANLEAILTHKSYPPIKRLTISGQQREVVCTNHDALAYFETSLKQAIRNSGGGVSYQMRIDFDDGSSTTFPTFFDNNQWSLACPSDDPNEGWMPTRVLIFQGAQPAEFDRIRKYLDLDYKVLPTHELVIE
ncbi:MAG: hypothetical protein SGJ20_00340 [Planctomycetota bacterium]|nr:hypothetical protein [Planctomycetota bacterium]